MSLPALFQVTVPGVGESPDELGVWQPPAAEAFSAPLSSHLSSPLSQPFSHPLSKSLADQEAVSLWQVVIPEDPQAAQAAFDAQAARLQRAAQALPQATRRLEDFIRQNRGPGGDSFALARAGGGLPGPEQELAVLAGVPGTLSFSFPQAQPPDWQALKQGAAAFFERVRRALLYFAWVESATAGGLLGRTCVDWTGHIQTVWRSGQDRAAASQHMRSLELALHTRSTWVRMALLVTRGGLQLGILFPANPLLAVPAAWRFFKQVLALAHELDQP